MWAFYGPTSIWLILFLGRDSRAKLVVPMLLSAAAVFDGTAATNTASPTPPEGLYVKHDVVSEEIWKIIQHWLKTDELITDNDTTTTTTTTTISTGTGSKADTSKAPTSISAVAKAPIPWQMGAQNRKVAQFGFRYNYETSGVEYDDSIPPIPTPLRRLLLDMIVCQNLSLWKHSGSHDDSPDFTQCIINVYESDTIIPWHWDHVNFGPVIVVFVFGETRPLHLRRLKNKQSTNCVLSKEQCHHLDDDYSKDDFEHYTVYPNHRSCYVLSGPARYEWEHSVPTGSGLRISITFRSRQLK